LATSARCSGLALPFVTAVLTEPAEEVSPADRLVRSPAPGIADAESVTTVAVAKPTTNTRIRLPTAPV
jgi:hypothetical protein